MVEKRRVDGTVKFFVQCRGFGFIKGDDGVDYFTSVNDLEMDGFCCLCEGWRVVFNPARQRNPKTEEMGWAAKRVHLDPKDAARIKVNPNASRVNVHNDKVTLRVDAQGRLYAMSSQPVAPHSVVNDVFRAYLTTEKTRVFGIDLCLPEANAERAFVLLDEKQQVRRPKEDGAYQDVRPGSYILCLTKGGELKTTRIGRRTQSSTVQYGEKINWVTIEVRLSQMLDMPTSPEGAAEHFEKQISTSGIPRLRREDTNFVPGVVRALQYMQAA